MNQHLSLAQTQAILDENFAPWIKSLGLTPVDITPTGATFKLPQNPDLSREGDIVCGQAIAAAADTAGVLTLCAHNNDYKPLTTVDFSTNFMRPLFKGDIEIEVTILSNGRRMATLRVDFRTPGSPKVCAGSTCTYAYL